MSARTSQLTLAIAALAASLVAALALAPPATTQRRERLLEVLLVNVAPRTTRQDCLRVAMRSFGRREANVSRMGSDRVRDLAGHRDDGLSFLEFSASELDPALRLVRSERPIDAVILLDCRAEEQRVDAWVRSANRAVTRLSLRRTVIDDARAEWLGQALARAARIGWNP